MILDYLWRYPPYIILLIMVDLVSVSYPPVFLIPRSMVECILYSRDEKRNEKGFSSTDSHFRGDRHKSISFFYYLILTTILWGVADQFPQPQYKVVLPSEDAGDGFGQV